MIDGTYRGRTSRHDHIEFSVGPGNVKAERLSVIGVGEAGLVKLDSDQLSATVFDKRGACEVAVALLAMRLCFAVALFRGCFARFFFFSRRAEVERETTLLARVVAEHDVIRVRPRHRDGVGARVERPGYIELEVAGCRQLDRVGARLSGNGLAGVLVNFEGLG